MVEECRNTARTSQRVRKHKKKTIRAEECNNWNEKYTRGNQQQIRWYRRMDEWSGRQNSRNDLIKQQEEKIILKNEDSLRDFWDNIKYTNICITGVPEGKEREKGTEKLFGEIMTKNFPNLGKETHIQV